MGGDVGKGVEFRIARLQICIQPFEFAVGAIQVIIHPPQLLGNDRRSQLLGGVDLRQLPSYGATSDPFPPLIEGLARMYTLGVRGHAKVWLTGP